MYSKADRLQAQLPLHEQNVEGPVVFFDGECNLCNGAVNYLIDHDHTGTLKFASLQSNLGQQLLKKLKLDASEFSTMLFWENGYVYLRATAALKMAKYLGWRGLFLQIGWIFPGSLRDLVYNFVANNRYKWFGKRDSCRMPTPDLQTRFLD